MNFRVADSEITVNVPSFGSLMAEVSERLAQRQGFAVATLNLDHLVKLSNSPAFRAAYAVQDLVVADGNPVVWLSWLMNKPVGLVPGSDLVLPLAVCAAARGARVAMVGSTPEALERAAERLMIEVPGLSVVCRIAPSFGFDPTGEAAGRILEELRAADVQMCFVALGAPKQEILAARGRAEAPAIGFVSVGAGLDFLSGHQSRAPWWLRRLAMEWLWRMLTDPARLVPRYAACMAILPALALDALRQRVASPDSPQLRTRKG